MAIFVSDAMTGTNWDDLNERTGEIGATWAKNGATSGTRWYIFDNKVHCGEPGAMYASGTPASANYYVECDYTVKTLAGHVGIAGRMNIGSETYYQTYYDPTNVLLFIKKVNGAITILGNTNVGTMSTGNTYKLKLDMVGTTIRVLVDNVQIYSVVDSSITAAGKAGVRSATSNDAHTGKHIDNFVAVDTSTPPAGTAQRAYGIVII